MFDIGFWELVMVAIVALLVAGPNRLPKLAAEAGMWFGKLQRFIRKTRMDIENELHQYEIQQAIREQQRKLEEFKQLVDKTGREMNESVKTPSVENQNKETPPGKSIASDTSGESGRS
jgi:sec-independent protein translocase protein TatB